MHRSNTHLLALFVTLAAVTLVATTWAPFASLAYDDGQSSSTFFTELEEEFEGDDTEVNVDALNVAAPWLEPTLVTCHREKFHLIRFAVSRSRIHSRGPPTVAL